MNQVIDFFQQHLFLSGLFIGLVITLVMWARGFFKAHFLKREIKRFKESMYTKMQIEAKGQKAQGNELEGVKRENENLRITVQSLQQKPGRAEIRQLHIFDKAIHSLLARSPGFGPAWEIVLKEAEEEIRQSETGIKAFIRQVFSPQSARIQSGKDIPEIESKRSEEDS